MKHLKWLFFICLLSELGAVPLLTSMTTSLKYFDDSPTTNITTMATDSLIIAVDYHYQRGEIYFSDGLGRIHRAWLRQTDVSKEPIIIAEVKLSDGLAVDWINNNIYWTDVTRKTVEMATLDGLHRRILFNSTHGVDKPRAIVLDPLEGLLFWSDWGTNATIESSGLDGYKKETIVSSDLKWPNGLALDINQKKIYILEGFLHKILSCNYDGSNLKLVYKSQETLLQSFGLTFFANNLYWGSWRAHTLFSLNVETENIVSVYKNTGIQSILQRMMGIKAVHPSLQKALSGANPCAIARCSHLCLYGRGLTPKCVCPYGYKIGQDGSCIEEGYLLISWRLTIRRYTLQGKFEEPMIDTAKAAIAIDYHWKKDFVFWSDIEEHRIYRAPLSQLNNKTAIANTETCDGLAVDWVHDVIYWTDTHHNTLEAATLDGSKRKVIFSENLDNPRDIAVDPFSGFMFWTDWGASAKVERAVLDGSDRKVIVTEDVAWPNGITIDLENQVLYWTDGKLSTISSCLYDGSERKLIQPFSLASQPFAITFFKDTVYFTEWSTHGLYLIEKNETYRLANSSIINLRPNGVKVVHSSLQKEQENPCSSLNCKDLCLGTKDPHRPHCNTLDHPGSETGNEVPSNPVESPQLIAKVFNDSIQLSLFSSKVPSLSVIEVKCISRDGCSEDKHCSGDPAKVLVFVSEKLFNISGLLPASHYEVSFRSPDYSQKLQLATSANDPPEIPQIKGIEVDDKNITLIWDPVDTCVPGFNGYNYNIFKEGDTDAFAEGSTNLTTVSIPKPTSAGVYTAQVYTSEKSRTTASAFKFQIDADETHIQRCKTEEFICDGKKDCKDGSDENIDLCAGIQNLIVYKKNNSEVHFRCQVTNSTIKGLDKFVGSYSTADSDARTFEAPPVPCVMWADSYCFHVSSLKSNQLYSFSISVALKGGVKGNPLSISTVTKEGVPGPPENLHVTNYSPSSAVIQWHYPNESNGIIRNFIVNIHEVETFDEANCCKSFPIIEMPVDDEEPIYTFETSGLLPASTYAVSVTAKTLYVGSSKAIDVHSAPPPMEIVRYPNVLVFSLLPLSWQPTEDQDPPSDVAGRSHSSEDVTKYQVLIKSYLLLLLPPKSDQHTNYTRIDVGPLKPLLESKFGSEYVVIWHKNKDDQAAFQQPIRVTELVPRKQYRFVWIQVSQYKDAYSLDFIMSDPFISV